MDEFCQNSACHVCKKITPMLKRCSRCKLYAYCSKEHQKIHWYNHKEFCNMVHALLTKDGKNRQHVFDIPNISDITYKEWSQMKIDLKFLWQHLLGRKLTKGEDQLWMFPRVCEICRISKQDILIDCATCFSVSYCCIEHQKAHFNVHNKFCRPLKLCYEINAYLLNNNKNNLNPLPKISSDTLNLPENTEIFVENLTISTEVSDFANILTGDIVSPFLSIIFALESCNLVVNRRYFKNSLVIHLAGASFYEMSLPLRIICEFFLHWITNLTHITLILIGPEVIECFKHEQLCHECIDKSYSVMFERNLYHDYVNSESSIPPDVIAVFNCGFHEYENETASGKDIWAKSLYLLTNSSVPLLLTAYTIDEARKDLQRLQSFTQKEKPLDVVVSCLENRFRGSRPLRDWATRNSPIFYQNNYVTVVKPL